MPSAKNAMNTKEVGMRLEFVARDAQSYESTDEEIIESRVSKPTTC